MAFFSFEHYPFEPCKVQWSSLYDEAELVTHIAEIWRQDGVPANVPLFITESNLSWNSSEAFVDTSVRYGWRITLAHSYRTVARAFLTFITCLSGSAADATARSGRSGCFPPTAI